MTLMETQEQFEQKAIMVHGMMLVCHIDGPISSQQLALVESYAKSLPEFFGRDFHEYYEAAKSVAADAHGSVDQAVSVLVGLTSVELRKRLYVCATELARAGGLAEKEEKLLLSIQHVLEIDHELVREISHVLDVKYGLAGP
ncbi:hypothetical protein ACF08N_37250 [Streptomyces sp. NPDC015127]|uniref:hypothetical protein n=1 Tax=Streptomyces sp. NPDC015127 TaxID=3364939 RepID=UPI0037023D3E